MRIGISPMMAEYASQLYYCAGVVLLVTAVWQEWHSYYNYNTEHSSGNLLHGGDSIIMAFGLLLAALRPLRSAGVICNIFGAFVAACGAIYVISYPVNPAIHIPAMVWAVVGIGLVIVGVRLACTWTQVIGAVAIAIGFGSLLTALPMHDAAFTPIFNGQFMSWLFVAAAATVCHLAYRRSREVVSEETLWISQIYYCATVAIVTTTASLEWWTYQDWYQTGHTWAGVHGQLVLLAAALLACATRPLRPQGTLVDLVAVAIAAFSAAYGLIQFERFHSGQFVMFFNTGFLPAALFVTAAAVTAVRLYKVKDEPTSQDIARWMGVGLVVLSWVLVSMEIYWFWYWRGRSDAAAENWQFNMQMCISISWAVYAAAMTVVGFWRSIPILRYMALGLFGLLLAKVFIIDTSSIKNVYRMGAFLATGLILVLVSYLYQFLKKKGFFEPKP
jgi:uncharacterized membrane protein